MPIDAKQYDSALDFITDHNKFSRLIGNLSSQDDKMRLKAYELYEDMYHNRPEHIRITLRGSGEEDDEDSIEIYMPSAKKSIEAINRYLAVNLQVIPDPFSEKPEGSDIVAARLEQLFKRERVKAKFINFKRYGLMKGDSLLHIIGNRTKRPGFRLSIEELKPEHYFPIESPTTGEVTGCYIVDIIPNPKNTIRTNKFTCNDVARRQTYKREYGLDGNATGRITSELALFEIGKWDERCLEYKDISLIEEIQAPYYLPKQIEHLPVYHWHNGAPPMSTWGMSELAGSETIVSAINQSMSDEDLTLIMQGLGVYWTDASPPMNSKGEEVEWEISPRSVVQVASGGNFQRVSGITTVQPFGDHIEALDNALLQSLGLSDIAVGQVGDSSIAESGISRLLKFSPLLAKNSEKELDLHDVLDQFIYDIINGWLPAYEAIDPGGSVFVSKFDPPMPKDKSADLQDLLSIWNAASSALPVSWFYAQLNDIMGYELDYNKDFAEALTDAQKIAEAAAPPAPEPEPATAGAGASSNGSGG